VETPPKSALRAKDVKQANDDSRSARRPISCPVKSENRCSH